MRTLRSWFRTLSRALEMYCLDHNGSMPFGIYFVGSGPPTWQPPDGNFNNKVSWASELNRYFNPPPGQYSPLFQCPEAQQQAGPHPVSYVMNMIVGVSPYDEIRIGAMPPRAQTKPPSMHLMLNQLPPGTALMWDTVAMKVCKVCLPFNFNSLIWRFESVDDMSELRNLENAR